MNASAISTLARIAAVAVVLILAAAVGLLAGNLLRATDADAPAGAGTSAAAWEQYQRIEHGAEAASRAVDADAAAAAYEQYQRIEHGAGAAPDTFTQTWGNLDERSGRDADATEADGAAAPNSPARSTRGTTPR